jgi:SEC-C motif
MKREAGKKIGRNEPCLCGSGKKYKRCHGYVEQTDGAIIDLRKLHQQAAVAMVQRERQQGLGNPIISAELNGYRLVAVKNRLLHSQGWKTFHDFLGDYIKMAIGPEWGNSEIAKPLEQRHPILVWYQKCCELQRRFVTQPGKVANTPMTGAVAAYMHLAYDLYALDHNAELQEKLLARLRNHDKFTGARYETHVAALFIRAGFDIEFEDETDGSTTHCEFTATHKRTGKQFSVEAKRREGSRLRVGHLFNDALSKHAKHIRVIFIDVNMLDDASDEKPPAFFGKVLRRLRSYEGKPLNDQARPAAYVFVTNTPWSLYLDAVAPRCAVLAEGFQIPDFKGDTLTPSLRRAIDARAEHIEMHELLRSIQDHTDIPSTFNGEIPEYEFSVEKNVFSSVSATCLPTQTALNAQPK